jgi:predicted kinase
LIDELTRELWRVTAYRHATATPYGSHGAVRLSLTFRLWARLVRCICVDMSKQGRLHLMVGPVGAGKTTYVQQRIAQSPALFLDVDTSMVRLFGEDPRPVEGVMAWYLERRERCRALLWEVALATVRCGTDVYVELGLVQCAEREAFYERARAEAVEFDVYVLDAPRSVRRERVANRNRSAGEYTQIVPMEFFERASDTWEPPLEAERARWNLIDV